MAKTIEREAQERPHPTHHRRTAMVSGLAGGATIAVVAAVEHTVVPAVPYPPIAISQVLVRTPPGGFDSFFIDALGHWAQRLAVIGTCATFLLAGAVLGLVMASIRRRLTVGPRVAGALAFLPLWAASVGLYPAMPESLARWPYAIAILPVFVLGGVLAARTGKRLAPARRPAGETDLSRRYFLRSAWVGTAGLLLGAADVGMIFRQGPDPGSQVLRLPNVPARATIPPPAPGDAAFAHILGLTPEVTSIAAHYVVDEEIINPSLNPATWRLSIGGLVRRPLQLSYDELKRFDAVERYQTLECVSNQVGGYLMSTAKWIGVPLPSVLERVGVGPGAVEVVFRAAGGYSDSLSIDQAMDSSTLIAIGMNGHVLPRSHGFPARLLSIGNYGMKNPKWLTGIDVVSRPYQGFWEQRGWTKPAIVRTSSRIDTPPSGVRVGRSTTIAGVAFAGDRGISAVEVSTDGGRSWNRADLKNEISSITWRMWRYIWTPARAGRATVVVRAVDGTGAVQPAARSAPFPSGSSGYDAITVVH